jgi:hypothetical protein
MERADLGSGDLFLKSVLHNKIGKSIVPGLDVVGNPNHKFKVLINLILQVTLAIEHLHQSNIELFHADFKMENIFVKSCNVDDVKYFRFKINGKRVKVLNLGFAAVIADYDLASISLKKTGNYTDVVKDKRDFRVVPPLKANAVLGLWKGGIVDKYANMDVGNEVDKRGRAILEFVKPTLLGLVPNSVNPIARLYSAVGAHYFKELDLYIFYMKLMMIPEMRKLVVDNELNMTLLAFLPAVVFNAILEIKIEPGVNYGVAWACGTIIDLFAANKEYMRPIFTDRYLTGLKAYNYKIFGAQ